MRLAFKANWNDILFPEDQNVFDKIAFEILTKPDELAPFPFAIDDKRTSLKKSINRNYDKLKAETKTHGMPGY